MSMHVRVLRAVGRRGAGLVGGGWRMRLLWRLRATYRSSGGGRMLVAAVVLWWRARVEILLEAVQGVGEQSTCVQGSSVEPLNNKE